MLRYVSCSSPLTMTSRCVSSASDGLKNFETAIEPAPCASLSCVEMEVTCVAFSGRYSLMGCARDEHRCRVAPAPSM